MDRTAVIALAKECGKIVTVEEHQVAGGMGSAVAEILAVEHPTMMAFIGAGPLWTVGCATRAYQTLSMDKGSIKSAVKKLCKYGNR